MIVPAEARGRSWAGADRFVARARAYKSTTSRLFRCAFAGTSPRRQHYFPVWNPPPINHSLVLAPTLSRVQALTCPASA